MNQKLNFDSIAYRRLNLPLLWASFIPSFLLDLYTIKEFFKTSAITLPGGAESYGMWLNAWIFLFLCNQAVFKGIGIYFYFHIRKLRKHSYVLLKPDEVIFFKTEIVMTRREMEGANEGLRLPKDAKKEFLMAFIYHIKQVEKIYRYANGAIEIQGKFQIEIFDEIDLDGTAMDNNMQRTEHRCVIPAYFEEIEIIHQQFKKMIE